MTTVPPSAHGRVLRSERMLAAGEHGDARDDLDRVALDQIHATVRRETGEHLRVVRVDRAVARPPIGAT